MIINFHHKLRRNLFFSFRQNMKNDEISKQQQQQRVDKNEKKKLNRIRQDVFIDAIIFFID